MIRSERSPSRCGSIKRGSAYSQPGAAAAGFSLAEALIYIALATSILAGIIFGLLSNIRASQRLELKQRADNLQGWLSSLIDNEVREGAEICKGIGCGNPDWAATGTKGTATGLFTSCRNITTTGITLNDPRLENMYFTIVIPVSRTMPKADFLALQRQYIGTSTSERPTLTPTVFGYDNVYVHYAHFTDPTSGQESLYRCGPPLKADGSLDIGENSLPQAQLTLLHLRTSLTVNPNSFPITDATISDTYRAGNTLSYKLSVYPPKKLGSKPIYKSPVEVITRASASVVDPTNPQGIDD